MKLEQTSVIVGLDWADQAHMCSLYQPDGKRLSLTKVEAAPEIFGRWLDQLRQSYPQGQIVVVIERPDGAVVEMMRERSGFVIVAVNPVVLHRFRQAFAPSGAKGDPGDAALLAELVLTHPEKFEALEAQDPQLRTLAALVQERRHWVDLCTALVQQLIDVLKKYYPQALELAGGNLASPMALSFLRRWPDLAAVQRVRWSTLERFYCHYHSSRDEVLTRRRKLHAHARPVSEQECYMAPLRLHMQAIVGQLEALAPSVERFDEAIAQGYRAAAGCQVIDSLPGAGKVMAPRLWVACQQAGHGPTALDLALFSGIAPVQKQSGQSKVVSFRHGRPRFLHQTWTEFAYHSILGCGWAKAYYNAHRAKGHGKHASLRALAFKWTRIVARLWRDQVPYDDAYYTSHRSAKPTAA
jgi:transposase